MPNKSSDRVGRILWVIWGAILIGLVYYRMLLVSGADNTKSIVMPEGSTGWLLYLVPIVIAVSMRWLVIPRIRNPMRVMVPFIVGISFAETLTFFGIFIFPKQFTLFYFTSWALMLQLAPLWRKTLGR